MPTKHVLHIAGILPLATLLFTGCGGASCPNGFEKRDGRCLPADGGPDGGPGDAALDGSCSAATYYRDDDGDGFGLEGDTMASCEVPDGYAAEPGDCDDTDDAIHPDAEEACNGLDDDCDETLDEGLEASTFYRDADGDGFGTPDETLEVCAAPDGWTDDDTDCDDSADAVSPDATESCNDTDDDCDGAIDEGLQGVVGELQQLTTDGAVGSSTASIVAAGDRYVAAWIAPDSIATQARFVELDASGSVLGTGIAPIEPTSTVPQREVRLAALDADTVVATWAEAEFGDPAVVRARLLDLAGGSHTDPIDVDTNALRDVGASVTVAGDRIVFAWLEHDTDGRGVIWVRSYDTGLSAPTAPDHLELQTERPVALVPVEGDPTYVLVVMATQVGGDTEDHGYVERVQLSPLGPELDPMRIDEVSPVTDVSAAEMAVPGMERPVVGATITGSGGVELVRFEPGELGSSVSVSSRTTLSPAANPEFNATAGAGGTFDGLVYTDPASDIIAHFPVGPDGDASERFTFAGSDFIAAAGAARLSPSQGGALVVVERASTDVWFQKLGCE